MRERAHFLGWSQRRSCCSIRRPAAAPPLCDAATLGRAMMSDTFGLSFTLLFPRPFPPHSRHRPSARLGLVLIPYSTALAAARMACRRARRRERSGGSARAQCGARAAAWRRVPARSLCPLYGTCWAQSAMGTQRYRGAAASPADAGGSSASVLAAATGAALADWSGMSSIARSALLAASTPAVCSERTGHERCINIR